MLAFDEQEIVPEIEVLGLVHLVLDELGVMPRLPFGPLADQPCIGQQLGAAAVIEVQVAEDDERQLGRIHIDALQSG